MASVVITCAVCGNLAERGIGGTGPKFCGRNCKQRDYRRRQAAAKAERHAFVAHARKLTQASDWAALASLYKTVPDGFDPDLTAAIRRLAELAAESGD